MNNILEAGHCQEGGEVEAQVLHRGSRKEPGGQELELGHQGTSWLNTLANLVAGG